MNFPRSSDGGAAASDEMPYQRNDGEHQQNMNQPRGDVECRKTKYPHQKQHKRDNKKHLDPQIRISLPYYDS